MLGQPLRKARTFLVSPVLDVYFSRRFYAAILGPLTAMALFIALINLHHLAVLEVALIAGVATAFLNSTTLFG